MPANDGAHAGRSAFLRMKQLFLLTALLACPLHAADPTSWNTEPVAAGAITLSEPAADEVVVVINDNAFAGNHAGLFAGSLLVDPAGSYLGVRRDDRDWQAPTLSDYVRYQTVDGLKVRVYRFRLLPQDFSAVVRRIHEAGPTAPLFCASAVQNLLAGIAPFEAMDTSGWTTPNALGRLLDPYTRGGAAVGVCQDLDGSPC
jgi:hypothetical protein